MTEHTMNKPILTVASLSVEFSQGEKHFRAVDDVAFSLNKGETLALVGESGSGKSVTAHSILKLLPYPVARHPSGSILFEEQSLLPLDEKAMRGIRGNKISMIFQEPLTALNPLHTVGKQIGEIIALHHPDFSGKTALNERVVALLEKVKIRDPESKLNAYPHELSGGQRQRVMIAMAIANEPDLLIADEPTTALDVTVQAQIIDLLKDIQARMGMAILLITHDFNVVKRMADSIAVMKDGKIVEVGPRDQVLTAPSNEYTQMLLAAEPHGHPVVLPDGGSPILSGSNITVDFQMGENWFFQKKHYFRALDGIDFELLQGETLGIVGESGSGKSTLAAAILQLTPSVGDIVFSGTAISKIAEKELRPMRKDMQMVFQDPFGSLSPRMSIAQIIGEGLNVHDRLSKDDIDKRIVDVLDEVDLDPAIRHRYPHEFSGGQRQRIAIARAIILKPKLIVLDEPTSALDRSVQGQVIELLKKLQHKYQLSYLFISHDLKVVRSISHKIIVMREGKIVESGSCESLFTSPKEKYTKELLQAALA